MKCRRCGNVDLKENDNFCKKCGNKLRETCDCWIKKDSYNCNESSCPGYGLFSKMKLQIKRFFC